MGYLDYTGLQHLWDKLKEKFAPKSHSHDDRYYTESETDGKLNSKANNNEAGANGLLSKLTTSWTATPTDNTYFIRQDTGGGDSFGRVKFSTLWNYIKSKADAVYSAKSHTHTKAQITDFPASLKNPTALTIQTNGATAATYDGSAAKTVNVTKGNIGLGNVDNTADKNKSVASAAKLTTARTVSGGSDITLSFNYDGSGNSTANIGFYSCKHLVGNTNNYPFHRFAKLDNLTGAYADKTMLVYITQDYNGGGFGICRLSLRTNNSSSASTVEAKWLVRSGLSADFVQVAIYNVYGKTYADAFIKTNGVYSGTTVRSLSSGGKANPARTWTLVDSNEVSGTTATDKKTSSECWKTIAEAGTAIHKQAYSSSASATDNGYAASAGSANSAASCTGNAASATKLTSSAGSAIQPVYFKDGKPVATTYSLNKTVPADAKFTDTNTWRGVQNNLTSDSTSDSLSAAQGKALKGLVDGKAPNGHTHNSVNDAGDDRTLTLAYSKDGLAYKSYLWLAGWNGNELRAVDKNQFATAEHGVTASGSNYVRFGNGTQICWGITNCKGQEVTASFAVAFNNTNYAVTIMGDYTSWADTYWITGNHTTTSFAIKASGSALASRPINWIAVGTWK